MKKLIIIVAAITMCLSCSKNKIQAVSGNINGLPAITLYGSSSKPTDYIFLSTAAKEMSYNGITLNYVYSSSSVIFVSNSYGTVAKATLDTSSSKITLTIETTYGFTFASSLYVAY